MNEVEIKNIYDEHKNLVYNLALNYFQQKEEAEDVTQEVFIKVYNSYHSFDNTNATLKTWIYRITVNTCLDIIKKKKSKKKKFLF